MEADIKVSCRCGLENSRNLLIFSVVDDKHRYNINCHIRRIGVCSGFDFKVEVVGMPCNIPERNAIVFACRHLNLFVCPNIGVICGVHVPVAGMWLASACNVIVRDGDAGLPSVIAANPAYRRLVDRVASLKSFIHNDLRKSHRADHQC